MTIRTKIDQDGNLLITADNEGRRELAEEYASSGYARAECYVLNEICPNSDLEWIPPETIGALTDAPIIGEAIYGDDDGIDIWGRVWWFPDYMVCDPWDQLRRKGRVVFPLVPKDETSPEPRPLDAVAARVVAEMAAPRQECRRNVREAVSALIAGITGRSMVAFCRVTVVAAVVALSAANASAATERTNFDLGVGRCTVHVSERDDGTFYALIWPDRALHGPFRSIRAAVDYVGKGC